MFTKYILVQKLKDDNRFEQFFSGEANHVWHHLDRGILKTDDERIFPLSVSGNPAFVNVSKGRETSYRLDKIKKTFNYKENYSVPSGFMIAVVMPKKYVPITFSFGEKAKVPFGEIKSNSPGYIEVLYNSIDETCTVVFTIKEQTNFQFSCEGCYCDDDFPSSISNYQGSPINAIVKSHSRNVGAVTNNDLVEFASFLKKGSDLDEIVSSINEIKELLRSEDSDCEIKANSIMSKIFSSISITSGTATLLDSYLNGNSVSKLISIIILAANSLI